MISVDRWYHYKYNVLVGMLKNSQFSQPHKFWANKQLSEFLFFKGFWVDPRAFQHPPVKQVLKYNNCFKTSTDNWPFLLLLVLLNILVKHFLVCTTNKKLTYPCNMDCTPEENQRMDWSKCWDDNKSNKKNAMLNTDKDKSSPPQLLHLHTYVDICGTM